MVAMAHKYERPTAKLPADWEAIGRLVREETVASLMAHFGSLASLFDPPESSDPGVWGSRGEQR